LTDWRMAADTRGGEFRRNRQTERFDEERRWVVEMDESYGCWI
jgi:hypothetical protein